MFVFATFWYICLFYHYNSTVQTLILHVFFQGDVELCVTQLEKVVPNYLLRFDIDNSSKSGSPIANSHSDYGSADYASSISSSISSSPTTLHQPAQTASHASSTANTLVESPNNLPNEMNESCILVR